MQILKQSTATTIYAGPVLDSAGAAVTTAVVGDFRLVKNGTAATLSGATVTHDANGYYTIALTTGNTDTLGRLTLAVGNTAMSMATHRYTILLASVFDALLTNATNSTGGLVTATAAITGLAGVISTLTAAGVRTELATELGRMDASVSSRSSHTASDVWQVGTRTLTAFSFSVTVGTIGNNVITAATLAADAGAEIAAAVRSELATELARIDAATSTRSSHSAADVWAVTTRTLTAFGFSVTVGTNNDKLGYSLATAPLDASGTAAAVWGALLASYTTANTFGARVVRSSNTNNTVQVTGSNHVAADIHDLQPAVIQASHFSLGAIDANALAADAAAEIASAVRTNLATELGRIDVVSSTLASQSSVNTLTAYVDTEVAAIKAKTDALPANPAATSDIPSVTTIADAVLSRSVASVEGSAAEHTLCTLVLAAMESSITGTTWTIRRTGGTTHYTKSVTVDSGAAPVVGVT